ncbi:MULTISPECIES: hypothetical protein [Paenibacillus]|uniref:hypothetical protein n=1 Tax=Paenibacillus TaxID=44249 RepID=UPI000E3E34DC|nr:hypothetical protein [Paenibacillus jamilae]RFT99491.1 hypothetical protein DX902_04135 [Paenibacillus jamilae]
MRNKKLIIFSLISVLILVGLFYVFFSKKNKEVEWLYDKLGIQLPEETSIWFSDESYGALGDGYRLYIYQTNSEEMKELIRRGKLKSWSKLPLPTELSGPLMEKIKGITSEKIAELLPLKATKGYYTIRNSRTNGLIMGSDVYDFSFNNVIISVINLEDNKIYFLSFDM